VRHNSCCGLHLPRLPYNYDQTTHCNAIAKPGAQMSNHCQVEPAAIARFFSSTVIKELARRGKSPTLARLIRESGLLSTEHSKSTVGEFLDHGFGHLKKKKNRHEYIYKAAITQRILLGTHSLNTASMLTEFRVGGCKADVVILNGTATADEMKSERDSLTRLEKQVKAYMKVFANTNVIVGENHLKDVLSSVPEEVGIQRLSADFHISEEREPKSDETRTCSSSIFDSITLDEASLILSSNGVEIPKVPNTQRYRILREAFVTLSPEVAHRGMVEALKRTRNLLSLKTLLTSLPESLHSASISTRLRKSDHERLSQAIKTPLSKALQWS